MAPASVPSIHVARLVTHEADATRISDRLAESLDPAEATVAAFADGDRWTIEVQFSVQPNQATVRGLVALVAGNEAGRALVFTTLQPRDWTRESLAGLKPVDAGRFVVHGRHDRGSVAVNRIGIEVEAALAFGTGHHGTTRGCLLALEAIARPRRPRRILDVGTGTGVLAIAAAKRWRVPVLATDIDPRAVAVATANARANGAAAFVHVLHADGAGSRAIRQRAPFDLVLANILLAPLKRLAVPVARLAARESRIVLSGLLASQQNAALAAYRAQGFVLARRILLEGWATLVLTRDARRRAPLPG
jgi:ribosomal protein L11 methyltransferase